MGDTNDDDELVQRALALNEFTVGDVAKTSRQRDIEDALIVLHRLVTNGDLTVEARSKGGRWMNFYSWVN